MIKMNMKSLKPKPKIFPANVSVHSMNRFKTTDGQESVTLLVNRRHRPLTTLRCRLNKLVLVLIIICVCLLIFYANSDILFRQRLFSLFLSSSIDAEHNSPESDTQKSHHYHQQIDFNTLTNTRNYQLRQSHYILNSSTSISTTTTKSSNYNIFVIYTKENYHLHMKFDLFAHSLLKHTSLHIHLHIITDNGSESSVVEVLQKQIRRFHRTVIYTLYDVNACSSSIRDISSTLTPYFSSSPNSYYSDALFFLSLGLHRIADFNMERAILLDCDIVFRADVRLLFAEFERFMPHQLFGLAPELTPVYRHILYRYRANFPKTNFGNPFYPVITKKNAKANDASIRNHIRHGYPGLNSGVVLLYLSRIRSSQIYEEKLTQAEVNRLTTKYSFKGHLGDQDFFTLLGFEYPNMIYRLDCIWNRQLCTWWKDHGYSDIFDAYFRCDGVIRMYHGNCNTRIPE